MLFRRFSTSLLIASALALGLAGCECDNPDDPDAGDAALPDGAVPDGSMDPDGGMPMGPTITVCPGDSLPPLDEGVCEATPGDDNLLITGDVLTPGEVFRGGQVLVGADGNIACVGCDCTGEAAAAGATEVVCPDGVVSPGLINTHEHLSFQALPYEGTAERYEHRHDWRRSGPSRGHEEISNGDDVNSTEWDELRMVMAGVTSVNGSGSSDGLARNLDRNAQEGLGQPPVEYDTFPLDDGDGTLIAMGCDGYSSDRTSADDIAGEDAYTPHIAEGIDQETRNEFLCQRDGEYDLIEPNTAIIHGVGLLAPDIAEMADEQTALIWSPRTNIFLYGDTARVTLYDSLGVLIALGTDWQRSGSMNMLRELQCADAFNADYLSGHFTDEQLWLMATRNAAVATATDDVIGTLAEGRVADLAIYDASTNVDHRAVIDARPQDVALVLRGGEVLYGETPVVDALESGCDMIDVCGASRAACLMREIGQSYSDLTGDPANSDPYPLFFCDTTPTNEPTCVPARDAMDPLPSPIVDGSNRYDGMITASDMDGDGIANDEDNCPGIFNPVRPLDMGSQADFDMDGEGDACDPCPLDADTTECTPVDPNDRDRDMVVDTMDNCPNVPNMDQADEDEDGIGDVCDLCPMDANPPGTSCPGTIYQVKMGDFPSGSTVAISRSVVTAVGDSGFAMQVPTDHPDYVDPNYSGVYVYTAGPPELSGGGAITRGMTIDVDAEVSEFAGQTQLGFATITESTEASAVPDPVVVTDPATVDEGGAMAEALEGVLVTVEEVAVTNDAVDDGQFEVEGSLVVGDFFFRIDPFVSMGENFDEITGVLFAQGGTKLQPRDADDYLAGAPQLARLEPAFGYSRVGDVDSPTFPDPLTVHLTRASGTDTTVTVTSSSPTGLMVADVTVPAGSSSAPVPVTAVTADPTAYTITATLGGDSDMADVRVLGAAEMPSGFTLSPSSATVSVGAMETFTVTLDIPAPPGGTMVVLGEDTGGTVPSMVTIPADALSTSFDYMAPASEATGTLTASITGLTDQTASLTVVTTPGTVILNEVDYDQDGTDSAEYVELHNPGAVDFDLTGIQLVLVNGSGPSVYDTIDLSSAGTLPAGGYLVVRAPGLTVASGALTIDFSSMDNNVQNGGPDGLAVWDSGAGMLLDALSYEGSITSVDIDGTTVSLVEGTATSEVDDASSPQSLSRIPDGSDTDDASTDWMAVECLTPGEANRMSCP
ncbi:MAG TPA: lamin tail domain-containing protein [Sandaracinaceae bacterium LLY-WYZ-13_1]|nr:lamin tail domain-containing protein [Sandaracinaceae bacterium LLY-WYZ-13_1]